MAADPQDPLHQPREAMAAWERSLRPARESRWLLWLVLAALLVFGAWRASEWLLTQRRATPPPGPFPTVRLPTVPAPVTPQTPPNVDTPAAPPAESYGVTKCLSATGQAEYSDRPCPTGTQASTVWVQPDVNLADEHNEVLPRDDDAEVLVPEVFAEGRTRSATVQVRVNQAFFRRAVLASYLGRCCMSGLAQPRLLVASHIVPWGRDKANRLNPRNGLLLSTLHDKAFDVGLITISEKHTVMLSSVLKHKPDAFTRDVLLPLEGTRIALPKRFTPDPEFLARHRAEIFVDA